MCRLWRERMLVLAGRRHPMIEFEVRTNIARGPAEVFALLRDVEQAPAWQRNIVAATRLTPGETAVGSEFRETLRMMGRTRYASLRVVACRPPEVIAFAGDAGFADYYCAFELTATPDGGTALVSRTEFKLHGLWRLAAPMLGREIKRETGREMLALKSILEARGAARLHPAPIV
jgi:uncharacterized protein YndB with AHSA1/START domain